MVRILNATGLNKVCLWLNYKASGQITATA
jgi:hypothetical protein